MWDAAKAVFRAPAALNEERGGGGVGGRSE